MTTEPADEGDAPDLTRLLRISKKLEAEGYDSLDADERAYLQYGRAWMQRLGEQMRKSLEGREAITAAGFDVWERLPPDLQERWAHLTPAQFALLAQAFPEEIPPELRHLLEP